MTYQQITRQKQIEQIVFNAIVEAQNEAMRNLLEEETIICTEPDYEGKPGKYYFDTDIIIDKEIVRFTAIQKAMEIMEAIP